jgi:DNA-binding response OmpR family regulator
MLIVDRDQELVELFGYILERAGLRYARATNSTSAVEVLAWARPSVVLLDTRLDLLQHFTRVDNRPAIIILTTDNTDEARVTALQQGADEYVQKPFSPRELVARIHACLRRSHPYEVQSLS